MKTTACLAAMVLLLHGEATLAQGGERLLAASCAGCHGTDGYSAPPIPRIAGLDRRYLATILKRYKNRQRSSTVMGRIARAYSDHDLGAIAGVFGERPWRTPAQRTDPARVAEGLRLHRTQCASCHQDLGRYTDATVPRLAGQWRQYLEITLRGFHQAEGSGSAPPGSNHQMLGALTSGAIQALAEFYASQK